MDRKQIVAHLVTSKQTNLGSLGVALVRAGYAASKSA